jgi:hypothetical protein
MQGVSPRYYWGAMFRRRALRAREAVIVHTKDGLSFYGHVQALYADCIVLSDARSLPDREKLVGDIDIPWDNYSWSQRGDSITAMIVTEKPQAREMPVLESVG